MNKYLIYDLRDGLAKSADLIVEAESPSKAVEKLYTDVKRDYGNTGDIVVRGNHGSYVYNGKRNDIEVVMRDEGGRIYTELRGRKNA